MAFTAKKEKEKKKYLYARNNEKSIYRRPTMGSACAGCLQVLSHIYGDS